MKTMDTPEADRIHFAVLAIEAAAQKMGISPAEMRRRLKKQQLIDRLILRHYNVFHTMSLQHVGEDVVEALQNWEADDKVPNAASVRIAAAKAAAADTAQAAPAAAKQKGGAAC